jgi:hypothetical protein
VHGDASNGHVRVAGQYVEMISYNDGTQRSCTTDNQDWSATSN